MKKKLFLIALITIGFQSLVFAQDTFSIVAMDPVTGEVGSAGASCVDLFQTGITDDTFLGKLFPNLGAINTQAWYSEENQNNATTRMNAGDTPSEIIDWLVNNDISGEPQIRQYGVVAFVNGTPEAAAHTGTETDDYKNHITGGYYSIQGNILSGQNVLDAMEANFLAEEGDLACKLMAALQGANMIGADARCTSNGTSSLFAFLKVAQPTDVFGNPSFKISVRTHNGDGMEPIDALQTEFDAVHSCSGVGIDEEKLFDSKFKLYPNPMTDVLTISSLIENSIPTQISISSIDGKTLFKSSFKNTQTIAIENWSKGVYIVLITQNGFTYAKKLIKI